MGLGNKGDTTIDTIKLGEDAKVMEVEMVGDEKLVKLSGQTK